MPKSKKPRVIGESYKDKILRETGWTPAEYKRFYTSYAKRVRNYNRAARENLSPAKELYNYVRFKDVGLSKQQRAIIQTPATQVHYKGEYTKQPPKSVISQTIDSFKRDFSAYAAKSTTVALIVDLVGQKTTGTIVYKTDYIDGHKVTRPVITLQAAPNGRTLTVARAKDMIKKYEICMRGRREADPAARYV